jgi:protein transport protein SEC31
MSPVVQLWDLRFATSPLKTLAGHTRAVTGIAWCAKDPDLLLSCGRDNRILCWNPNEQTPVGLFLLLFKTETKVVFAGSRVAV